MNDKKFPTTLRVALEGSTRNVATAYEALECLLGPWPITRCREYRKALRACRDCLDGLRSPASAFRAFKAASRAIGAMEQRAARKNLDTASSGETPHLRVPEAPGRGEGVPPLGML